MKAHTYIGSTKLILIALLLLGGLTVSAVTYADSILPAIGFSEGSLFSALSRTGPTTTAQVASEPSVMTDKDDYLPGEIVQISGSGFWPNEVVTLQVVHIEPTTSRFSSPSSYDHAGHDPWQVMVNADGTFSSSWLVQEDSLNKTLLLTADQPATADHSAIHAETTFTDAAIGGYDQCANDDGDGEGGDPGVCDWINGNLNGNNSTYPEGTATVQRAWLTRFPAGSSHTITFQYGTTKNGTHAYDYLTRWDWSENWITLADRCDGIPGCTTAAEDSIAIPNDPNVTDTIELAGPGAREFVMRGGDMTSVSTPTIFSGTYGATSETNITISFTVPNSGPMCTTQGQQTECEVVIWFGAHVARSDQWTAFNGTTGAGNIAGSPYHVALFRLDDASVGNRDNQMQASAVVANGAIQIVKNTVGGIPGVDYTWGFTPTGFGAPFNLQTTGTNGSDSSEVFSVPAGGNYSVTESGIPAGWDLTSATCTNGTPAAIVVVSGVTTICTFTNTEDQNETRGRIIVDKVTVPSGDSQLFTFNPTGFNGGSTFQLADATTPFDSGLLVPVDDGGGPYAVSETVPADWVLTSAVCSDGSPITAIDLDAGETVTCTFTNTKLTADIEVSKSVDIDAICEGSTTLVTYTYQVTNPGTAGLSTVTLVDDNGTPGDNADDFSPTFQSGDTSNPGVLDPGETWIYTADRTLDATTTNTVTATGTTAGGQQDSDTSSATVTASVCTINIDKSSDIDAVCAGSETDVTYTYTVTTNATVFDAAIAVSDDNGTPADDTDDFTPTFVGGDTSADGFLDPGETWTYSAVVQVGADVTNTATATATFNDSDSTVDTDSDTATVTAYNCTITVTKTPSATSVCNGATVTYDYTITNNSPQFTWTGTLVDDVIGDVGGGSFSLTPGQTRNVDDVPWVIDGTVINTVTGDGTFDDGSTSSDSDTASATVNGNTCRIIVKKVTVPAEDPVETLFGFTGDVAGSIGHNETIEEDVTSPGAYSSTETDLLGWDLTDITCNDANSSGDLGTLTATFNVEIGETVTCTFTNTERGTVTLIKTENGQAPTRDFTFEIREGATPEEDGTLLASGTAGIGQTDPVIFDCVDGNEASCEDIPGPVGIAHFPPGTYQLCETGLLPGWTHTLSSLGTVFVPNSDELIPDNTVECVDIVITAGDEFDAGIIDNRQPGDARTIGFWKNWTSCDGTGNQAPALDYVLSSFGGATVDIADTPDDPTQISGYPGPYIGVWLGLPGDGLLIDNCLDAVSILDKRSIDRTGKRDKGRKAASDPAFNMAAQLLAAQLNLQAGATAPSCLGSIIDEANQLLADVNFNGLQPPNYGGGPLGIEQKHRMNYLAGLLDDYNNNVLDCDDYTP